MKFTDFEPKELIGKTVLYVSGQSYSENRSKYIRKINRVTKTGFSIVGINALFSFNGNQKGLTGRHNMGTISECKLITEEEANQYREEWKMKREHKIMFDYISESLPKLTQDELPFIYEAVKIFIDAKAKP